MYNANIPSKSELPSTAKLIKSTLLAIVAAGFLLVTTILPAEYGVDPTGIGKVLGLTRMGEIKVSLAEEAATERADGMTKTVPPVISPAVQAVVVAAPVTTPVAPVAIGLSHEMQVTLVPNEGTEIKVDLEKGKSVKYTWWTDGGKANFDVHADSKKLNIDYHNYSKGSLQRSEGVIEAAFDGSHGWFWRNRTAETITITLQTSGDYTDIKHIK